MILVTYQQTPDEKMTLLSIKAKNLDNQESKMQLYCKSASVDAAVTVGGKDAAVELTRTYSQRVTEVTTHKLTAGDKDQ